MMPSDSLEKMLDELAREYAAVPPSPPVASHLQPLPSEAPGFFRGATVPPLPVEEPTHPALRSLLNEELEAQRKAEAQRALEEESRRQREEAARRRREEEAQREAEAIRHREAVEAQRRQQEEARRQQEVERAIRHQAEQWLAKLDPYSIEGQWFTVFAARYKDRISAAVAYLREVKGLG
ncbi:MAG: hypothetical protein RMJ98_10440 [Myxococcales bacterium]|nr:hypothetical protein [Polyangiaceae bacterium]MDW8249704.1 hypothetical protein [Myxococcales bacterium]